MNITELNIISYAMYIAFITIREEAVNPDKGVNSKKTYVLSDLFHNVPSHIVMIIEGSRSTSDVLEELHLRAKRLKCETWLNRVLEDARCLSRKPPTPI
jgi:hypothetical protein